MHQFRHFFARMWRSTFENVGLVVIQPLKSVIPIKRLNSGAHPAAKVALTVGVNLDLVCLVCFRNHVRPGRYNSHAIAAKDSLEHPNENLV